MIEFRFLNICDDNSNIDDFGAKLNAEYQLVKQEYHSVNRQNHSDFFKRLTDLSFQEIFDNILVDDLPDYMIHNEHPLAKSSVFYIDKKYAIVANNGVIDDTLFKQSMMLLMYKYPDGHGFFHRKYLEATLFKHRNPKYLPPVWVKIDEKALTEIVLLACSANFFSILHELAHIHLKHFECPAFDTDQLIQRELDADIKAIKLSKNIDKAVFSAFKYLEIYEHLDEFNSRTTHPYTYERILNIYNTFKEDLSPATLDCINFQVERVPSMKHVAHNTLRIDLCDSYTKVYKGGELIDKTSNFGKAQSYSKDEHAEETYAVDDVMLKIEKEIFEKIESLTVSVQSTPPIHLSR